MMKRARSAAFFALVPVLMLSLTNCSSCKKDDEPPPVSSAAPTPTPTPVTTATIAPEEDAGAPVDAGTDAGHHPNPGGGSASSIAKCCAALQQNANSAPLDQKAYYLQAAAACQGMKNTPSAQQAFGQLRAFLAGAKMPGACK